MMSKAVDNPIVVSISCITYNHAPYIRQCLDGFLMQKTNFAFEVLIHDDASTDGTTEIIKEYEAKYPDIIKPIYEEENQWVKGRRGSAVFNFPRAKGKYIALCEGDDYWTDPQKLQKQVDFLEQNQEFVLCVHHFQILEGNIFREVVPNVNDNLIFKFEDYICNKWYTQTLTAVIRRSALDLKLLSNYKLVYDCVLFYNTLQRGNAFLMRDNMGVYRKHPAGLWSLSSSVTQKMLNFNAVLDICRVENNKMAANYLYNCMHSYGYLGLSFFKKGLNIYCNIISIIYRNLGLMKTLKLIFRSINYFSIYSTK